MGEYVTDEDNIRFSFRSNEHDVEIVIQGPPSWVNLYRERIGMEGDIGFVQEVSNRDIGSGDEQLSGKVAKLPGREVVVVVVGVGG